jgi:hypothetical protein
VAGQSPDLLRRLRNRLPGSGRRAGPAMMVRRKP